jgi:hypothetical protein
LKKNSIKKKLNRINLLKFYSINTNLYISIYFWNPFTSNIM